MKAALEDLVDDLRDEADRLAEAARRADPHGRASPLSGNGRAAAFKRAKAEGIRQACNAVERVLRAGAS